MKIKPQKTESTVNKSSHKPTFFKKTKPRKTALLGIMLGMVIIITTLEAALPPFPFLPPHMKPGLANVLVMYCVFFTGRFSAIGLNIGKAVFVFVIRGPMAGVLSFSGGLLSVLLVILLVSVFSEKISYIAISILSAAAHNFGQLLAVGLLVEMPFWFYYLPVLLGTSVVLGTLTGAVLKALVPAFRHMQNGLP